MTEFQKKRLQYFINSADKYEWVRLGKEDADTLEELINGYANGYDQGFDDGIKYVISGEMDFEEQKKDALKGTY